MENSYREVVTYVSSNRNKLFVIVSAVGAGLLFYLARRTQWNAGQQKETKRDRQRRVKGVPMDIIKDEMAKKRSNTKTEKRTRNPVKIVAMKDGDNPNLYQRVTVAETASSLVSNIVDLAIGKDNLENDETLLKAMSDLDSAINQLEQVLMSLNISKVPFLKNGLSTDLTIQAEIKKLQYLLDLTSVNSKDCISLGSGSSSTVVGSWEETGYSSTRTLSYEECALYKATEEDDETLVNAEAPSTASDDDSFISAVESLDAKEKDFHIEMIDSELELNKSIEELKDKYGHLELYAAALDHYCHSDIPIRSVRTAMVKCDSDIDFYVKVHCLRQGFKELLVSETMRRWFVELGRNLIGSMLKKVDRDYRAFEVDFDALVFFCQCQENWPVIEEELKERGVCVMSFYDIILDFIVMDAFEDLENPPYAVTTAVQNRWLSDRIKETALTTAVWSILKAKKQMLRSPNGFLAKMYNVSQHVSPVLAWGFLGPVTDVRDLCNVFKDSLLGFMEDIFSTEKVSFRSSTSLADSIYRAAEHRKLEAEARLFS